MSKPTEKIQSSFARRKPSQVTEKASFIFGRSTGYGEGYAAGLIDGAWRERRALLRFINNDIPKDSSYWRWVRNWLAARSKPAKGKGGRNGK